MSRGVYVLEANRWRALSFMHVSIRETSMKTPPLDPEVSDTAPAAAFLTPYDEEHLITHLRLLDAQHDCAVWAEVARLVLHIDPQERPPRALTAWETHLVRAPWLAISRPKPCFAGGPPNKTPDAKHPPSIT